MKVTKTAKLLTIEIPLEDKPTPSGSGKSLIVASTRGNVKTDVKVDGKDLVVSVNAYIPA